MKTKETFGRYKLGWGRIHWKYTFDASQDRLDRWFRRLYVTYADLNNWVYLFPLSFFMYLFMWNYHRITYWALIMNHLLNGSSRLGMVEVEELVMGGQVWRLVCVYLAGGGWDGERLDIVRRNENYKKVRLCISLWLEVKIFSFFSFNCNLEKS